MVRIQSTRRGMRITECGTVLSEVLSAPGPTHSIVDVMAAAVQALVDGPRVALLGFAGGGVVAPLRAMGGNHRLAAVDIEDRRYRIFQRLCRSWCGRVMFHRAEACRWLRRARGRFDAILEDLSISSRGDVVQPEVVWKTLPVLVRQRLRPQGLAVFNLIRPKSRTWDAVIGRIARPFARAHVVAFEEFENRVVLAGCLPRTARRTGAVLRRELAAIGSRLATRISVRTVRTDGQTRPYPPKSASALHACQAENLALLGEAIPWDNL